MILQFSAPIDAGAAPESLLAIHPPVDGVITLPDSMTLQFTPRTGFKPGVRYDAQLSDKLRALDGAQVAGAQWAGSFTLWLELENRYFDVVRPTDSLSFRFNRRVQPRSRSGSELPRGFRFDPPVPGHVEWPDSMTLRFVPESSLTPGREYLVTIGPDFVTLDGFRLASSVTVTIRPGMRLGSYSGAVSLVGPITLSVLPNRPVARDTVMPTRGFRIEPHAPGSLWWTYDGQLEFRPDSVLQPDTDYRLIFETTFRGPDGLPLVQPDTISVRTPGRRLVAAWPVSAHVSTFVSSRTRFRFVFAEPIHPEAWADTLYMTPPGYYGPGHPCRGLATVRFRSDRPRPLQRSDSLFGDLVKDSVLLARAPPTLITVIADRELPAGCAGTLTVGPYVDPMLSHQVRWPFQTAGEFRLRSTRAIPGDPVPAELNWGVGAELVFTTPVSESELERHVRIDPPVAARFVGRHSPTEPPATVWQLLAAWAPATAYRISADSTLRDAFGQRLAAPFAYAITTAPATPAIVYESTHRTVSTRAALRVDVTSINVRELRVCVARVPDSMRTRLVGDGWWTWNGLDSVSSESTECRRLTVRASPSDSVRSPVHAPWKRAWRSRPAGLYAVRVSSPQPPRDARSPSMVVFHVTDLGVHARLNRDRGTVLVAGRSDGTPVAGAAVTARDCSGDVIARAATDSSGLAELVGMAAAERRARFSCDESSWRILEVTTPHDYDAVNVPLSEDSRALIGPLPASVFIPDRRVYRRDDSIRMRAVVRPSPDSARWVVVSSERVDFLPRVVLDTMIHLSRAGVAELAFPVGPRRPPGVYGTALLISRMGRWRQLTSATFRVTEDPPPRAHVALIPDRSAGARGDSVGLTVEAWSRDGAALPGVIEVSWAGERLNPYEVVRAPQGFFTAEVSTPPGVAAPESTGGGRTLTLDADGTARFMLRLPDRAPVWPWRMTVRATVPAAQGRSEAGHATVDVHPASFNLAMRPRPAPHDPALGTHDSLDVVALRPDGAPMPGIRIDGLLAGRKWSPAPQESDSLPGRAGAMVLDTLDRCDATTTDRPARCMLRRLAHGYATVLLGATDALGRRVEIERPVDYRRGRSNWSHEFPTEGPALTADHAEYLVGDTALVRIENLEPGGIGWLTVASGDRIESQVLRLSGPAATVRVPIGARHAPRVTVTTTIWYPERDGDVVTRAAATGQIDLAVRDPAGSVTVTMGLPDRAEAASSRAILITTDTGRGMPEPPEILVWAIDERLAAVDSQRVPRVAGALMQPPPTRRVTVSSLRDPAPAAFVPIDPGSSIEAGTQDEDPSILTYGVWGERGATQLDDVPGPFLLGAARAGRDGTAIVDVRMPEAAGRYRVIAVALTSSRLGRTEGSITVDLRR